MKLTTLLLIASTTASPTKKKNPNKKPQCAKNDGVFEPLCNNNSDEKSCTSGKLCCWSGTSCHATVENADGVAKLENCGSLGEGGKYKDLGSCILQDEEFNKNNLVEIEDMDTDSRSALIETVGTLKEGDDGSDEAKSGLLTFMTLSSMKQGGSGLGGMGGFGGINPAMMGVSQLMDSKYFTCPISVPHCQRVACQGHIGTDPQNNAMDCFAIPGCCYDSKGAQYKYLLGSQALKAPTCYKAIRTPVFHYFANQLASKTPFVPQFLTFLHEKVTAFIENDQMFNVLAQQHRCTNSADPFVRLQIGQHLQKVWPGYAMMQLLSNGKDDGSASFLARITDAFSTQCGWKDIKMNDCMMIGCCYNKETDVCSHPNDIRKIPTETLIPTIQKLMMSGLIDSDKIEIPKEPEPVVPVEETKDDGLTASLPNGAMSGALSAAQSGDLSSLWGRKRRSARKIGRRTKRQANQFPMFGMSGGMGGMTGIPGMSGIGGMPGLGGLAGGMPDYMAQMHGGSGAKAGVFDKKNVMLAMMAGGQGGATNPMMQAMMMQQAMGDSNGDAGDTSDMMAKLAMFGQGLGIGNANPQTCAADYKMDCMSSPDVEKLSFSDLFKLREKCMVKGCCWDQEKASQMTYQKNFDGISDFMVRATCAYNIPVALGGLPDLTDDMRGCCDFSPCVHTQPPAEWSAWAEWSECTQPCGGGISMRSRFCEGHGFCPGMQEDPNNPTSNEQVVQLACNVQSCESWAEWAAWSPCADVTTGQAITCGSGAQKRSRSCWSSRENREIYGHNAPGCQGPPAQDQACNLQRCPEWMPWGQWSPCSITCGIGESVRIRQCTYPGQCPGLKEESRTCGDSCWSEWTDWSMCSKSCLGGQQRRSRECIFVKETGNQCYGPRDETQNCNSNFCEIWMSWAPWSECVGGAGQICGPGQRSRSRDCTGLLGAPGCTGRPAESDVCSLGTCNWSEWQVASTCETIRGCGRGKATYQRQCPTMGGCSGSSTKSDTCELELCPGFSEWSEWTTCSVTCGTGTRSRSRVCNGVLHKDCLGSSTHNTRCMNESCPGTGSTGIWGQQQQPATSSPWNQQPSGNIWGQQSTANTWGQKPTGNTWGQQSTGNSWGQSNYRQNYGQTNQQTSQQASSNPWSSFMGQNFGGFGTNYGLSLG
jgi:hypothetical protein